MTTRLVDGNWRSELDAAANTGGDVLRIISPFIKLGALEPLLTRPWRSIQVITRFSLNDFASGVSDLSALRRLIQVGAQVRGIRGLHAKVYLFGDRRAIVTSANLTGAGLSGNHEFGLVSGEKAVVDSACRYFEGLWRGGRQDLLLSAVEDWQAVVRQHLAGGARPGGAGLGDYGAVVNLGLAQPTVDAKFGDASQAFVKFLGEGRNRVPENYPVLEEVRRSGCHWALGYPANKRPRRVEDGAVMFIARLVQSPARMRVFGRAIGLKYVPGRDDATQDDVAARAWKADWPRYVRVHHAEFVAGDLANGVSFEELMDVLGANAFVATQRNAELGAGNEEPRRAYLRAAGVELTSQAAVWLNARLEDAFTRHGHAPADDLAGFDWPVVPASDDPTHKT
jgi:hypothetical protein